MENAGAGGVAEERLTKAFRSTLTFLSQYFSPTTSEGKLAKLGHKIGKNLDKKK